MKRAFLLLLVLLLLSAPAGVQAKFDYTTHDSAITITQYTRTGGAVTISNFLTSIVSGSSLREENLPIPLYI